ncbi:hypothetical protein B0H19DRAFT_1200081, partial [Mycena capillaripes]
MADLGAQVLTREEELLADLFAANERLLKALKLYNNLKRVALRREAEDRSRQEMRVDRREQQFIAEDSTLLSGQIGMVGDSSSHSPSPPPARSRGCSAAVEPSTCVPAAGLETSA